MVFSLKQGLFLITDFVKSTFVCLSGFQTTLFCNMIFYQVFGHIHEQGAFRNCLSAQNGSNLSV